MGSEGQRPLAPSSLSDEIVRRLEAAIFDGTYPPGTRLVQDELCAEFGVSRTPIRQALRDLQARRLLAGAPNKGATVRVPTVREAAEVYGIRAELEGYAAELVAGRRDGGWIAELRRAHDEVTRAAVPFRRWEQLDAPAQRAVHFTNRRFHHALWEASGNALLVITLTQLEASFPMEYVAYGIDTDDTSRALNVDEHAALLEALSVGDAPEARRLAAAHAAHLGDAVVRALGGLAPATD